MKGKFIILDCETGGKSSEENPITEIALLAVDDKFKEVNRFSTFVKPYADLIITKEALDKTNISMKQINNGMEITEVVKVIIDFCKQIKGSDKSSLMNPVIVGHNVAFDLAFILFAFKLCKKNLADHFSSNNGQFVTVDTMQLSRLIWGASLKQGENNSFNLGNCCERAGIKLFDAHGAMKDVEATTNLLRYFSNLQIGSTTENKNLQSKTRDFFKID